MHFEHAGLSLIFILLVQKAVSKKLLFSAWFCFAQFVRITL